MKRIFLLAAMALLCGTMSAQDAIIKKYKDVKNVEVVHVSKAMMKMGFAASQDDDAEKMSRAIEKLDHLDVLNSEKSAALAQDIFDDVDDFITKQKGERLVEQSGDGESTLIAWVKENGLNRMIVLTKYDSNLTLVVFVGTMTLEEAQEMLSGSPIAPPAPPQAPRVK